jgi:hypothetical protein
MFEPRQMQELLGRVMFLDLICLKFFMTCVGVAKRVLLFPFFLFDKR